MNAFIPLLSREESTVLKRGAGMYNNYLSCEVCGNELTRQSQRQQLDNITGLTHSYCEKCFSEKFPGK